MDRRLIPSLLIACLGCLPLLAAAQAPAAAAAASAPARSASTAGTVEWRLPLARLLGGEAPLRMEGTQGELRWSLPVPALWQPREVVLELQGVVSQALIAGSQWVLELNGRVVEQWPLSGSATQQRLEVRLPAALLKPGYNELRLRYAQHYTERCEYPMAAQLWSQIDPAASTLRVSAAPLPVPERLDRLDTLFDKAGWAERPVIPLWTARAPDAALLQAMGLVAQGLGHRYDYVPIQLQSQRLPAAGGAAETAPGARGAIALGTFAELAPLLAGLPVPTDQGPVVALRRMPGDETRFVLLFAAARHEELVDAAMVFAMQRMPWPAQGWVSIRALKMPPLGSVTGAAAKLRPSTNAFPLSSLGYRTTTFSGINGGGATVRFWNGAWQGRVQVRVHASYAAGMSPQSGLNLLANGTLHGTIPFDNPRGARYDNYAITVPAGALRPGWNTLQLQPVLIPQSHGGDCQPFFPGNLQATVHEDTTVQTFGGSPLEAPDLALLAREGRPLASAPVGVGMAVQLADASDATIGAGLTLLAKLTQVFEGPLLRTEFRVGESESARNRIWVGPLGALPAAVVERGGLNAQGALAATVPLITSATVPVHEGGEATSALRDQLAALGARPSTLQAQVSTGPVMSGRAAATTVLNGGDALTVFTAVDGATLEAAMQTLVGFGPWSQLQGSLALWEPGGEAVQTVTPEDAPFTAFSLRGGLGLWVSQYPWTALLLLLVLLGALAWTTRSLLARHRRRTLPDQRGTTT